MNHFSRFFIFNKFPATYAFNMCVEYDKISQSLQTRYDRININEKYYKRAHVSVQFRSSRFFLKKGELLKKNCEEIVSVSSIKNCTFQGLQLGLQ